MHTIPGVGPFNVNDLKKLLNHLEGRVTSTTEIPSPFSADVREAQLSAGYCNTTSDLRFHGSSDPVEFLGPFNIEMDVYQMKTLFLTKFQAVVRYAPSVTTLANVKQMENESLTSYFKRFNAESTSVREVQLALKTSQRGRARKMDRSPSPRYRRNSRSPNRVNAATVRREWSPPSSNDKRTSGYTPLAASIEHIFELKDEIETPIKEGYLGEWVVKEVMRYKNGADKAKEAGGHTPRGSNNETLEKNKFVRDGSIRAIYGGDSGMECSNRSLERYARESQFRPLTHGYKVETRAPKVFKGESMDITFREADARWVHHPHNDALVIYLQIVTKNVHRTFVDNGRSENILYYDTYKKIGLPDRDMSGEDSWVYGFTGEGVRVMGSIRLSCTLGESLLSVKKMVKFKVLNQESSHNVLPGRPFLIEMRVITLIHHLTIKFPTPNGVGGIKISQYESRECYRQAMRSFRRKVVRVGDASDDVLEGSIEQPVEEIRVHYYIEQEDEYSAKFPSATLFLEDTLRVEILEEEEPQSDHIIQANFNGKRLEGRIDVLQILE
ncbi:uncharacterized protein LOC141660793 [Apium graveolens]|uniref:uncharacterized protein LOC141660793 n=1 Tax=Apium graveolens TaxID=4045 RepID=UPI003D797F4C